MSGKYADIALVSIDYSGGSFELEDVRSITVGSSDPKPLVKTMNRRRRATGRTRGIPEFPVDMDTAIRKGEPEVDWETLQRTGEEFQLYFAEGDDEGPQAPRRWHLVDATVEDISKPFTAEGESRQTIKLSVIDKVEN